MPPAARGSAVAGSVRLAEGFGFVYHSAAMLILTLSDIHGNMRAMARTSGRFAAADVVLLAGDITHFGGSNVARGIIAAIRAETDAFVLGVTGNCDLPEVAQYLAEEDILCEQTCRVLDSVAFAGFGGSLPCPGGTPNEKSETDFWKELSTATGQIPREHPLILLGHQPPFGTVADCTTDGRHVGSRSVRQFIEETRPLVCFCGHIHEGRGTDVVGAAELVNPGPFRDGFYALTELSDDWSTVKVRLCGPDTPA
ncbi:MAG TPA: metallophosphoesterase [Candidatus Hydrogenedentes bacterium]|nr:metallophosphoesterase [Candidatus Hydrogenedentota bacterium]HQM47584.1 metallophosphoesterase [Candidatus Hydrogenedentota bacterium]